MALASDHRAFWTGEHPCHSDGRKIRSIENDSPAQTFGNGLQADFMFSAKALYREYAHKITTYLGRITGEAAKVDPHATAPTFPAILADGEGEVFKYADTATSRAGNGATYDKVTGQKIGIIGLGGTGSYVLDPRRQDSRLSISSTATSSRSTMRSARRTGAELEGKPKKVAHFMSVYEKMRNGIVVHDAYMTEENVACWTGSTSSSSAPIAPGEGEACGAARRQGYADRRGGHGLVLVEGRLGGIVRETSSTAKTCGQAVPHVSYADGDGGDSHSGVGTLMLLSLARVPPSGR